MNRTIHDLSYWFVIFLSVSAFGKSLIALILIYDLSSQATKPCLNGVSVSLSPDFSSYQVQQVFEVGN
jgi:hypothetical protein